jgi:hypothetical protein
MSVTAALLRCCCTPTVGCNQLLNVCPQFFKLSMPVVTYKVQKISLPHPTAWNESWLAVTSTNPPVCQATCSTGGPFNGSFPTGIVFYEEEQSIRADDLLFKRDTTYGGPINPNPCGRYSLVVGAGQTGTLTASRTTTYVVGYRGFQCGGIMPIVQYSRSGSATAPITFDQLPCTSGLNKIQMMQVGGPAPFFCRFEGNVLASIEIPSLHSGATYAGPSCNPGGYYFSETGHIDTQPYTSVQGLSLQFKYDVPTPGSICMGALPPFHATLGIGDSSGYSPQSGVADLVNPSASTYPVDDSTSGHTRFIRTLTTSGVPSMVPA